MSKDNVEEIKATSNDLRGTLAEELAEPTVRFRDDSLQVLKFHGVYQQDDRDARKTARVSGAGKDYSFMVRLRAPGGRLLPETYLAVDELADVHGNGTIRITTREGLQLHGIRKSDLKTVIAEINAHLGSTLAACGDVTRNVMAPPWPIADALHADARRIADEIAMAVAPRTRAYVEIWQDGERVDGTDDDPLYGKTYLPRKFKIGVTVPGDDTIELFSHDLGVVPVVEGDRIVAYDLVVGGGLGRTHGKNATFPRLADPLGSVAPERLIDAVRAIIGVQRDHGDRSDRRHARLKYLIEDRGIAWFRERVEEALGFALEPWRPLPAWNSPSYLGWQPQGDCRWFYGLHVRSGRIHDAGTMRMRTAIRTIVQRFGLETVATPDQNLIFAGVAEDDRAAIDAILADHGVASPGEIAAVEKIALACPALPTCGLALGEAERILPEVIGAIDNVRRESGLAEPVQIRMTGCPNGCARPYVAEFGIVGVSLGRYDLHLGGGRGSSRLAPPWKRGVPLADIPQSLRPVFERYRSEAQSGESFGDYCARAIVTAEAVPA